MSTFKRCISLLLVMLILVGVFAPAAQAAPAEETATVDTDAMTIKGTNGFGNLLSQEITESQEEAEAADAEYPGGYTVTDLVIEGTTATVTYDTMEEATLVVALYTEDGMQMLTSATATVAPDATEAKLTFEGEMPEYFQASAYLLDSYDLSPLCAAYDTPMYTREMQELLASTVNDYDPEKVLNLDEDETTNFAVYADSTIVIESVEDVNTVASIDDENAVYVIKNADQQIKSLVKGDVFAYPYAEGELLIVKVETITISGTTVTITGTDMEMGEVFAYVKIDAVADPELAEVDANYIGNGVTYLQSGANLSDAYLPQDTGISEEVVIDYILDIKGDINLTGKLTAKAKLKLEFYITKNHQRITLALDYGLAIGVEVEADFSSKPISVPIGKLKFPVLPGVSVDFVPSFVFSATVTANLTLNFDGTFGVAINHTKDGWDVDNLCSTPDPYLELGVEGKVFAGLQLTPALKLLGGFLADMEIKGQLGLQLSGKISVSTELISDMRHNCVGCVDGEVGFVLKITPSVQFLKSDKLKLETTLVNATFKVNDFYISPMSGIGWGECPNIAYKLTLVAVDEAGNPVADALVTIDEGSDLDSQTNEKGITQLYLTSELHSIEVKKGDLRYWTELVTDHSRKLTVRLKDTSSDAEPGEDANHILENVDDILVAEIVDMESVLRTPLATYKGHTYTLFDGAASTWDEAKAYCEALGGHLATIANANENTFLYDYMRKSGYSNAYWGLTDREVEGVWEWCTGEPVTYLNWATGEPNNGRGGTEHYGMFHDGAGCPPGYWNDGNFGDDGCAFLCEWDFILTAITEQPDAANTIAPNALYPGDYGAEVTDTYILKTASFKDLVPNEQYVLLAMASIEVENPLASDNLLFIDQAAAAEDGTLTFRYVQRTPCDISYVVACGASHKDLKDAEISFPDLVADGELQVVDPVVAYDGVTLTEGQDYVIAGKVDFIEAGEYTCYIRGIHNYAGLVECTYTVAEHEHSFTNYVSDGNATCTEDGTKTAKCDHCDATDTIPDVGSALGHSWDKGVVTREPTEDTEGERLYTCTACGATKAESIPVIGHEHRYEAVVTAPTCTERGYTTYTCKCGESYVADYVDALGHRFGDWTVIQEPTTTEEGLEERTCDRCGYTEQRSIVKLENPFADVTPSDYYYEPVLWALGESITDGVTETEFAPEDTCKRSQVVTFLWRAAGEPKAASRNNPFVDVKSTDYFYEAVLWAVEKGITDGMDETHFEPDGVCNRSQVVTFLYRAFKEPPVGSTSNPFTDVPSHKWYATPVLWAVKEGITDGVTETSFAPEKPCTRGQVVTFLYRAYVN